MGENITPKQIRDAAEKFALELLETIYDVATSSGATPDIERALAETDRRRQELEVRVLAAYGEEAGGAIVAEGHRIAKEIHAIAKRHCEETEGAAS